MKQTRVLHFALAGLLAVLAGAASRAQTPDVVVQDVLNKLNNDDSIKVSDSAKCYKVLWDAYLQLSKPPFEISAAFNHNTIHPKMSSWSAVSGWAESNSKMADAILSCRDSKITVIGLPYGKEKVDAAYVKANLYADVSAESMRNITFPYLNALDTMSAFVTAEVYRLMEAGQTQRALDLSVAYNFVLRLFCDRIFLAEKMYSIDLLSDMLSNLRDLMYTHQEKISHEQFRQMASMEIPFLRPDRTRLFMPEADRTVAEAMIRILFDERTGQADPARFTSAFAEIQSRNLPLTRFGAAKRWGMIALIHSSREDSLNRLKTIYDDWWRRWRVDPYDDILSYPTQFERTNQIRYAAVLYSIQDVERSFKVRNQLVAEVNGTAIAAGLCGYKRMYGTYPDDSEKTYTQFTRRRSDSDPYEKTLGPLRYRVVTSRHAIDTPLGQKVWIEPNECLLYSQGQNHVDNYAAAHADDGAAGDIVLWPPMKAVYRAQGLIE